MFNDYRRQPRSPRDARGQQVHQHLKDRQNRGHTAPRRVRSLSLDEIVRAAIKVADAEGADAVSMRRIAREVGAGAMSLYWHVSSKEELLDRMLDAVEAEQEFPVTTGDWRTDMHNFAHAQRVSLYRHVWVMDFIGGRPPLGPNTLRNLERALSALATLGLDVHTTMNVLSTVGTYVLGAVLREFRERMVDRRDTEWLTEVGEEGRQEFVRGNLDRLRASGRYPFFVQMFESGIDPDAADTRDARFEFGLSCLLDGIAARLARDSAPPPGPASPPPSPPWPGPPGPGPPGPGPAPAGPAPAGPPGPPGVTAAGQPAPR
jgi:AcrR family transcriptional regulator